MDSPAPVSEDLCARNFKPLSRERLYHYCAHDTLWAILDSRTLWLSSVHSLNDSAELHWGRDMAKRLLAKYNREFPSDFRFAVLAIFDQLDEHICPLIFSLSRSGDLLSQWRAYASDGHGLAIEFDANHLHDHSPVNMKDALYRHKTQVHLVLNSLRQFALWWSKGKAGRNAVLEVLPDFAVDLLCLKHPSFFEELEVRMVHVIVQEGGTYHDPGGNTPAEPIFGGVDVHLRSLRGSTYPYIALPIEPASSITGVVLGPKNPNPTTEVEEELAHRGLPSVKVRRSSSPYR